MAKFTVRVTGTAPVWADIEVEADSAQEAHDIVANGDAEIDIPNEAEWEICDGGNGVDDWEVSGDVFDEDGDAVMEDGQLLDSDEEDEDEPTEPMEGDLTTGDHVHFYEHGQTGRKALAVTVAEDEDWREAVKAYMDIEQFWPNVWFISDHGNAHLLSLNETTSEVR